MINPFKYSLDNKRYHTFNYYLKNKYNQKVAKVILDLDYTCPNRDGTKGIGGCIFCSSRGSGDTSAVFKNDIVKQYDENLKVMHHKWPNAKTIPYFQSFSNTYGPLEKLQNYVEKLIYKDEVVEMAIATRADCLDDETIKYLDKMSHYKPIWIELGLQSSNDNTAKFINRGHYFKEFLDAINRLSKTNIKICIHIINGLPYETEDDMLNTIKDIKDLPFHALKIHTLQVLKNTKLALIYNVKPFKIISRDEYINIVVKQLELIKDTIIIERLTGDPLKDELITPDWLFKKTTILNDIDKLMVQKDTYQGKYYESHNL